VQKSQSVDNPSTRCYCYLVEIIFFVKIHTITIAIIVSAVSLFLMFCHPVQAEDGSPYLQLTYPIGGEILDPSKDHVITWKQNGLETVFVRYTSSDDDISGDLLDVIKSDTSARDGSFVLKAGTIGCSENSSYKILLEGSKMNSTRSKKEYELKTLSPGRFSVKYAGTKNIDDVYLELIEPFDKYLYTWKEPFTANIKYNRVDTFSIGFFSDKSGWHGTQEAIMNAGQGIATIQTTLGGSIDDYNKEYKIKIGGVTNINACRHFNNIRDDGYLSEDTSESTIFLLGYPYIIIENYSSDFWAGRAVMHSLKTGGILPIRWKQTGDIKSVDITIVPIVFRSNPSVHGHTVVRGYVVPTNGLPYAHSGSFDWNIPNNFDLDKEDRRYEYTIVGYNDAHEKVYQKVSEVFLINKEILQEYNNDVPVAIVERVNPIVVPSDSGVPEKKEVEKSIIKEMAQQENKQVAVPLLIENKDTQSSSDEGGDRGGSPLRSDRKVEVPKILEERGSSSTGLKETIREKILIEEKIDVNNDSFEEVGEVFIEKDVLIAEVDRENGVAKYDIEEKKSQNSVVEFMHNIKKRLRHVMKAFLRLF
jgi:hypothetical protein